VTEQDVVNRLTAGLAAVEATMKAEFSHVNARLDSHADEIRRLAGQVQGLNMYIARRQGANGVRQEQTQQASENRMFWRKTWVQVIAGIALIVATALLTGPIERLVSR